MLSRADQANAILITFGAIGIGLLVFAAWMGLRYFFGWGHADNYQSPQVRPNRRLTFPELLWHHLRKAL
ncbi:MAG: hypothetical protein A3E01_10130 [Gammaproteobacteria bacterium RIFCSPHIGHO2_12_FULL_63_22]|nr:MAG: hypothetical protein A3E01_10130 [Gammaproteobacteria bacterium RIFCSPHIGHO2_12_FULL_63_22]